MDSIINVFIYEVKGPTKNLNTNDYLYDKYTFNNLSLKNSKNSNNTLIVPRELKEKGNNNSNKTKLFSKNIIKNKEDSNNENKSKLNLKNNLPFLYEIYRSLPARINIFEILNLNIDIKKELKDNIYNKLKDLIEQNTNIFKNYLIKNSAYKTDNQLESLKNNSEIIYNLYENDESNIIVMGDNHGSFHSFFRIILRLYLKGIITSNYKLKENYKLILLGDLIDRGNYGIELIYILLNLMINNNTDDNLNVILIRGNHEVQEQYFRNGFRLELKTKFKNNSDTINKLIVKFFKYCPSAIILNHLEIRYWLCHGGFPIKCNNKKINWSRSPNSTNIKPNTKDNCESIYKKISDIEYNKNKNKNKNLIYINNIDNIYNSSEIRWNDFNGKNETDLSDRDGRKGIYHVIGNKDLFNFLEYLNINIIIRGHTDNVSNAMILANFARNGIDQRFFILNDKELIKYYNIFSRFHNSDLHVFNYKNKKNKLKCDNEIVTIIPEKFKKKSIEIQYITLFPVLTISNNCDIGRSQYSDSFIIISSKEKENSQKSFNNNSIYSNNNNNNQWLAN